MFRRDTVRRRLNYRLRKSSSACISLEGLLVAFLFNINEVIEIICNEDEPNFADVAVWPTETQVEAILELKLRPSLPNWKR